MSLDPAALHLVDVLPLDARAATLFVATLVGGLVRGFTGFGFAMVFVPVAAAAVGPAAAVGVRRWDPVANVRSPGDGPAEGVRTRLRPAAKASPGCRTG